MSLRQVDFLHEPGAPRRGWWLLAVGAMAFASALWFDRQWAAAQAEAEGAAQRAIDERRAQQRAAVQAAPATPADKQQRRVQAELDRPWLAALRAIETATVDPVYLLSMKFERSPGQVRLEAEAPSFEAALAYTRRLDEGRSLSSATLVSHELVTNAASGRELVKFSVIAAWSAE